MSFGTMERRKLEVFFAMLTTGFGAWLLFPSEAMRSPALFHLADMASEAAWGGLFLSNGMMHCTWLAVNGARNAANETNAAQFFCSSGLIASGVIRMYGVTE